MSLLTVCRCRLRALFRRSAVEREMNEELRFHLEMQEQAFRDSGLSPRDAHDAALRRFGGVEQAREAARDQRGWLWLDHLRQDARYGVRTLAKSPAFTVVALVSLALGIGANTALFSLLNAVILRPLPVRAPHELRGIYWEGENVQVARYNSSAERRTATGAITSAAFSYATYRDFRDGASALGDVFAYSQLPALTIQVAGEPAVVDGLMVSGNYFAAYGAETLLGRPLSPDDDRPGAAAAAVITWRWWQRQFGGDPRVVGRTLLINRVPFTIAGVLGRRYVGPLVGDSADFYVAMALQPQLVPAHPLDSYHQWWVEMAIRLVPGADQRQARSAFEALFRRTLSAPGGKTRIDRPRILLEDGSRGPLLARERLARPLYLLLAAVSVLLLVACANVGGLLLARGAARGREFALRAALGAGRARLIRQCLTETLVLAAAGAALGLLLAEPVKTVLLRLLGAAFQNIQLEARNDARVLLFTAAVALCAAFLCGLVPALRATRVSPLAGLAIARRGGAARLVSGRVLVGAQIGLSVVLIVAAGLFLRTLSNLYRVDPGFDSDNLLLFRVSPAQAGYTAQKAVRLAEDLSRALAAIPGVGSVTFSSVPLLGGPAPAGGVKIAGRAVKSANVGEVAVGEGFFRTMAIPILLGRDLDARDSASARRAVVVNESFARLYFEGENALGRVVMMGPVEAEIVGVCRDTLLHDLRRGAQPIVFVPFRQSPAASVVFEVRTSVDPASLAQAVRRAAARVDRGLPVTGTMTQADQVAQLLSLDRMFAWLCGFVAVLAQALSCIGLHGLMAYDVARRTNEIGIRIALGARSAIVARHVLGEAMATTAAGLVLGVAGALAMAKSIESRLFGVTPYDPATLVASALLLFVVALMSAYVPARRASRVDPLTALRAD